LKNERKTLLILKCPYCEKETSFSHPYEPVDHDTKKMIECEECKKPFYATIIIKTEGINLTEYT